jgi:hypothetical protein
LFLILRPESATEQDRAAAVMKADKHRDPKEFYHARQPTIRDRHRGFDRDRFGTGEMLLGKGTIF